MKHAQRVAHVAHDVAIERELLTQPGRIGNRASRAPDEVRAIAPVHRMPSIDRGPPVPDLGFPLAQPLVTVGRSKDRPYFGALGFEDPAKSRRPSWKVMLVAFAVVDPLRA